MDTQKVTDLGSKSEVLNVLLVFPSPPVITFEDATSYFAVNRPRGIQSIPSVALTYSSPLFQNWFISDNPLKNWEPAEEKRQSWFNCLGEKDPEKTKKRRRSE